MSSMPSKTPPGYREGMYSIFVVCSNCGSNDCVYIPKGTPVNNYLKGWACSTCGCTNTLKKDE